MAKSEVEVLAGFFRDRRRARWGHFTSEELVAYWERRSSNSERLAQIALRVARGETRTSIARDLRISRSRIGQVVAYCAGMLGCQNTPSGFVLAIACKLADARRSVPETP